MVGMMPLGSYATGSAYTQLRLITLHDHTFVTHQQTSNQHIARNLDVCKTYSWVHHTDVQRQHHHHDAMTMHPGVNLALNCINRQEHCSNAHH